MCSVFMFAPGFTVLSTVFPPEHRTVAVALMGPINALVGIGIAPIFLGAMGDAGRFDHGFMILGCALLAAMPMLRLLPTGTAGRDD
jgi:NNP family nitrate/nitrite transporter-like MFS transporter